MKKIVGIITLLLVVIAMGAVFYSKKGNEEEKIMEVITKNPKIGSIALSVEADGEVKIKNEESIYILKNQRVTKVYVDEGDEIKKGDILISFDPEEKREIKRSIEKKYINIKNYEMDLEEKKFEISNITVLSKKRELEKLDIQMEKKNNDIRIAKIELENIKIELENTKADFEVKEKLFKIEGISIEEYNSIQEKKLNLEKELEFKINQIESLKIDLKENIKNKEIAVKEYEDAEKKYKESLIQQKNSIAKIKNNIKVLKLEIESLEKDLNDTFENIKSPVEGTVISVNAEENFKVNTENSLMSIADINSQYISAEITAEEIKDIKVNQKVKITSPTLGSNKYYEGKVTKIDSIAKTESGSGYTDVVVGIEVEFNEKKSLLKPGYEVNLEIISKQKEGVMIIPKFAVISSKKKNYVMLLGEGNIVSKKEIKTGISTDVKVEVLNLNKDDKIIMNANKLKEGQIVKPVEKMVSDVPEYKSKGEGAGGGRVMGGGPRR
ncbi:MAG: hypothetical protein B6I28_04055 [Fusobacteriia bacterium 4572_132]|nr:MAG: hypothetical protein B6I28_04055 [Fusobacteriia bacterium 4572_132]